LIDFFEAFAVVSNKLKIWKKISLAQATYSTLIPKKIALTTELKKRLRSSNVSHSMGALILLAHHLGEALDRQSIISPDFSLSDALPALLASLTSNIAIDESLACLQHLLNYNPPLMISPPTLAEEDIIPLVSVSCKTVPVLI